MIYRLRHDMKRKILNFIIKQLVKHDTLQFINLANRQMKWDMYFEEGNDNKVVGFIIGNDEFMKTHVYNDYEFLPQNELG